MAYTIDEFEIAMEYGTPNVNINDIIQAQDRFPCIIKLK